MAPQKLAAIAVRRVVPGKSQSYSVAVVAVAGCSHNRQSYRPIFASPVPVAKPCTNCGGSSCDRDRRTGRRHGRARFRHSSIRRSSDTPAASSATPPPDREAARSAAPPWKSRPRRGWTTNRASTRPVACPRAAGRQHDPAPPAQTR